MITSNTSPAALKLATQLVQTLPTGMVGLFNPWRDICTNDLSHNGPQEKLSRLAAHLDCQPEFILCGEAPGYQGCRYSGVAFTSEKLLIEGGIPRITANHQRLTSRRLPFSEPSATIVWKTLYRLGIAERTVMWNSLQMHPHPEGDCLTNRTPTTAEIALGAPALLMLIAAFPKARVVAVGRKAEGLLRIINVTPSVMVRHPANGGATEFADGMNALTGT